MRRLLLMLLALVVSGCSFYVVGDSTMRQIEDLGIEGSTQPGCGYTGWNGWPNPWCVIPLEAPEQDVVVAGVSIWDTGSPDLTGYQDAHDYYTQRGADVIWVEVPPVDHDGIWTIPAMEQLNADVADLLGCDLVPWTVREAEYYDGIHYTPEGAMVVAARFEVLAVNVDDWRC